MLLDARDDALDRLGLGRDARRQWLAGQRRRAEREIERGGSERHHHQRRDRDRAPAASRRGCGHRARHRRLGVGGRDQPPRDLYLRCLRLAFPDPAGRAVACNLLELIAIDGEIAAGAPIALAAHERPQHGQHRCRRHQREHEPERHGVNSSTQFRLSGGGAAARTVAETCANGGYNTPADAPQRVTGTPPPRHREAAPAQRRYEIKPLPPPCVRCGRRLRPPW